jgi:hypothetical protein
MAREAVVRVVGALGEGEEHERAVARERRL